MLNWTRRGFLGAILGIPLAGWSGFWRKMGVKSLYMPPIKPVAGQIYIDYLMNEHIRNVERAFLGFEYSPRMVEPGEAFANARDKKIMLAMGDDQDDVVLWEED